MHADNIAFTHWYHYSSEIATAKSIVPINSLLTFYNLQSWLAGDIFGFLQIQLHDRVNSDGILTVNMKVPIIK